MRFYIVVEGASGEPKVYPQWIKYTNAALTQTYDLDDTRDNTYFLISGNGYPNYLRTIENAIKDVNAIGNFDYLVIAVDSEDKSYQEKYNEIVQFVDGKLTKAQCRIIVQHFCFETWALGNRIACRNNTQDKTLLEYKNILDVHNMDPEFLPAYKELNRAQFAFRYLKCMLHDWYPGALYTKSRPDAILDQGYYLQIKRRFEETNHIKSFKMFLDTFK